MVPSPPTAHAEPVVASAGWLLRQIAAKPADPLTAALVGPGGTGKSSLLRAITAAYRQVGVAVVRVGGDTDLPTVDGGQPILVDDAHRLDPDALAALRTRARADETSMVVAYRPWPRPGGLSALGAQLSRHHSPIVLGHHGRAEVAELIARRAGCPPPEALVALVHEQAGGSPMFAGLVTQALLDTGRFDPRHPERFRRPGRVSVSPGLAERLRYLLEALDPGIYGLIEAMALGAPLDAEVLCALLDTDPPDLADTVEAARATGLLTEAGDLIVFVRNLVLRLMPVLRRRNTQRRLAEIQLDGGGPVLAAGRQLAESKATGARAAEVLAAAAGEALRTSPRLAVELYDAAVAAGGSARAVAAHRAEAAALAGDSAQALRLADQILTEEGAAAPDRRRAVSVSAAILARRGFAARTAELYGSLSDRGGTDALLAVPALLAAGELDRARAVLAAAPPSESDAPTLTAPAIRLLAAGMLETVGGDLAVALRLLAQAAGLVESAGDAVLLPYGPAELVAIVAAQCGEVALAETVLGRATAARLGGGLANARHLLLHGWNALTRGALDTARGVLDRVSVEGAPLEPGDELLAAALATGVARRRDDSAALGTAFERGRTALIGHPVDLFLLRQLGELAVAAAVLDERASIAPHLEQAWALLTRLGDPPLWAVPLHWCALHAELAAGDVDAAEHRVTVLSDLAANARHARRIADAAACWPTIARGAELDPARVRAAAVGLHHAGLGWDGAQLAATAALRTGDRKAGAALMAFARGLSDGPAAAQDPAPPTDADDTGETAPAGPLLSDRELEVGRLILAGLTHKQIGARLFISSKTVEHHVARMRNRLGADGRDELFGMLRHLIGDASTSEATG